jgi:predicted CoA-binding protein
MATMKEAAEAFLSQKRIAVAGVSRTKSSQAANIVYKGLRGAGYDVFAVNPGADEAEGDRCFHDLKSIPDGVDAVVIATAPDVSASVAQECAEIGIKHVWLHRSFGEGSMSDEASDYCREHDISVIAGGCPMMFREGADIAHRCMRFVVGLTGGLPKEV